MRPYITLLKSMQEDAQEKSCEYNMSVTRGTDNRMLAARFSIRVKISRETQLSRMDDSHAGRMFGQAARTQSVEKSVLLKV
jgi:hypothetical protein